MVFSVVCCRWIEVYVCICHRDNPWTVWDIIMKFWCEQDMMSSRTAAFRGWWFPRLVRGWFNVSDVLVKFLLAFHCNYMFVYIVPFLRYSTSNCDNLHRLRDIRDYWSETLTLRCGHPDLIGGNPVGILAKRWYRSPETRRIGL